MQTVAYTLTRPKAGPWVKALGRQRQVNLAEAVDEQAAAQAIASTRFGRRAAQGVSCRAVVSFYDPKSFIEIRVFFAEFKAGCFAFCQRGKGPDFLLRRWFDLDAVMSQDGCFALCSKLCTLLQPRAELVSRIKDVEGLFGQWYYDVVLREHHVQARAWVRSAVQVFDSLRYNCAWRLPFAKWGYATWQSSWTQGIAPHASTEVAPPHYPYHEEDEDEDEYDEDEEYE